MVIRGGILLPEIFLLLFFFFCIGEGVVETSCFRFFPAVLGRVGGPSGKSDVRCFFFFFGSTGGEKNGRMASFGGGGGGGAVGGGGGGGGGETGAATGARAV